ncbi:hypothetical protein QBC35DRAFT_452647 [Podospora australis]|uniref:Uncharacterized protein n=1 Tax=Podospora australis TaxID=1536484 RepID=A0AAN6WVJ4_9PEZI|nr:hypothetical protein QBC35DRAFT_452647 [Podospora australis]
MSGTEARLYVSYKHSELEYYMASVENFLLQKSAEYIEFCKYVRNIIDWKKDKWLTDIQNTLGTLLVESRNERKTREDAQKFTQQIRGCVNFAKDNIVKSQQRQAAQANRHRHEPDFKPGDRVVFSRNPQCSRPTTLEIPEQPIARISVRKPARRANGICWRIRA